MRTLTAHTFAAWTFNTDTLQGLAMYSGAGAASLTLTAEGVGSAPYVPGSGGYGTASLTLTVAGVGVVDFSGYGTTALELTALGVGGTTSVPNAGYGLAALHLTALGVAVSSYFAPADVIYTRQRTSESDGLISNLAPVQDTFVRSVAAVSDGNIRRSPERVIGE